MAKAQREIQKASVISADYARLIDEALANWFRHNKRDLEFRKTRDPYALMVSEFMLQQTTVAAVEPYYARFLKRYPTVTSLADSTEDEVMAYWAGLGYYRRARQLRLAAQAIVSRHEGLFPRNAAELQDLPGLGRYTAGAVLSSAFDLPEPVLEANTTRVFARLAGLDGMIGDAAYMRQLWAISTGLVEVSQSPRSFNIAAMELGALVCRPVPNCSVCPVQEYCIAYRSGDPARIPQVKPRREKVRITVICLVIRDGEGNYLLRRIPEGEWHAGMWEYPSWKTENVEPSPEDARKFALDKLAIRGVKFLPLGKFKYTVTHHTITAHVFRCSMSELDKTLPGKEYRYFAPAAISELAMGSAQRKILNRILDLDFQESA